MRHFNRRLALLSAMLALVMPVSGQAIRQQPMPPDHVWQTAPTPPGATSWELLSTTRERETQIDGVWYILPQWSTQVKALRNKTVRVNGYMMPLENGEKQRHFVLMAYPPSCPYCMTAGPTKLIEVKATSAVKFTYDPVLLEGKLVLLDRDESGLFYRLDGAKPVRAN
jgi:uncharacterized protein